MLIEVYSDFICPWCYLGQARLAAALEARADKTLQVHWLPFELNPAMPREGRDRLEYMRERFGDMSRFEAAQNEITRLGAELGLQFNFGSVRRSPNTRRAHMLVQSVVGVRQSVLVDRLFRAYFTEGQDIGDERILIDLAVEVGLSPLQASEVLTDSQLTVEVERLEQQARAWQISGVPSFIFDRQMAFSGAQPTEIFLQTIDACASTPRANRVADAD